MALFNFATKEITLKIVYYGPGLSGKTTNLQYLHSILNPSTTGKLLSLSTEADRTLFFDFLPVELGKIRDFSIRFQLYTVPGQVRYNATRRIVLKGADAVIFVADSQRDMREQNIDSFSNMMENLQSNNIDPSGIPIVLQYNKRDLPNILSADELNSELNANAAYPVTEAVATTGTAVEDTYKLVTKLLLKSIAKKHKVEIQAPPQTEEGRVAEQVIRPPVAPEPVQAPAPRLFAAEPITPDMEPFPSLAGTFGAAAPPAPAAEETVEAYAVPVEEEAADDAYALELEEEAAEPAAESLSIPPARALSVSDVFPEVKEEIPIPGKEKVPPPAEPVVRPPVKQASVSDIFAEMEKTVPVSEKKKTPSFAESLAETRVTPAAAPDIFAEMERQAPPKKESAPEAVEKKKDVAGTEVREVPVFPVEKIDEINQRIDKLSALLTEVNNTVARMSTSLAIQEKIQEKAFRDIRENKELRDIRKEHGEMNVLLKSVISILNSVKEKKSWFRF